MSALRFKIADTAAEFEQIHRPNHATFAGEIPQHAPRPDGRLVDRFHAENVYIIARDGPALAGMVVARDQRPFSLNAKLPELDRYLSPHNHLAETRLLAVAPGYRRGPVFKGLLAAVFAHCRARGVDLAVISGTTRQLRLYRRLGFTPFGPLVGAPGAWFQPMYVAVAAFRSGARWVTAAAAAHKGPPYRTDLRDP